MVDARGRVHLFRGTVHLAGQPQPRCAVLRHQCHDRYVNPVSPHTPYTFMAVFSLSIGPRAFRKVKTTSQCGTEQPFCIHPLIYKRVFGCVHFIHQLFVFHLQLVEILGNDLPHFAR